MMEGVVFGCEGRESEGGTKGKVDEACGGDGDGKAVGNAGSCGGIRDGMIVVAGRTAAESVGAPGICRSTRIAPLIWMPEKDNNVRDKKMENRGDLGIIAIWIYR
ncbi:unnamed protein product [Cuscuta campestris]|uniref:Uncharacterized protein n=1 Tax=Cuscuta campestris TaxID=132261 RepID=A0A484LDU8_9ASTE|nr:unnamed protein product [Cuscuta campestris]